MGESWVKTFPSLAIAERVILLVRAALSGLAHPHVAEFPRAQIRNNLLLLLLRPAARVGWARANVRPLTVIVFLLPGLRSLPTLLLGILVRVRLTEILLIRQSYARLEPVDNGLGKMVGKGLE